MGSVGVQAERGTDRVLNQGSADQSSWPEIVVWRSVPGVALSDNRADPKLQRILNEQFTVTVPAPQASQSSKTFILKL